MNMKLVFEVDPGNGNKINQIFRNGIDHHVKQRMLDYSGSFDYYMIEVDLEQCKKIELTVVER